MAAKVFEVGDVLPATTQLKVTWEINDRDANNSGYIITTNSYLLIYFDLEFGEFEDGYIKVNNQIVTYLNIYPGPYEIIINTSSWNETRRTVTQDTTNDIMLFYWEDLNAPSGYSITFEENGGSTVTDLTEKTALPTPLPTTTKTNNVFVGWYYDNLLTQKANAGDELTANVTLYAKWYTPTTWCEDIADAIREKEGSSGNIKHVDFADRIEALPSPKEEETKTVTPNFASGNVVVTPTSGKVMTQVTVNKDTTNHIASNIRSGKTLYGVAGSLQPAKEEETKTVTPDFSSGNVVVTPTTNKVMTQVTINKDTNHIASNIAKDKTLYGVTGTLESGGGNSLAGYGVVFTLCYTTDSMYSFPLTKVEIYEGTTLLHTSNEYPSGLEYGIYTWLFNSRYQINTNAFKIRLYGEAGGYVDYAKIIGLSSNDTSAWASPNLVNLTKAVGTGYTEWTCSVSSNVKVIVCLIGNND